MGRTALHTAVVSNRIEDIRTLLETFTSAERRSAIEARDDEGQTPIVIAASIGNLDVVQLLIDHGANVNASNDYGKSALVNAARFGNVDVLHALIDAGADLNQRTHRDFAAIHVAVGVGQDAAVRGLLERGSDVNARGGLGTTPLISAAIFGMNGAARTLLRFGADLSCEDELGRRAIHHAIINTRPEVLKILLEAGESPSGAMHDGKSYDQACRHKPQCLSVLQSVRSLQAIDFVIQRSSTQELQRPAGYGPQGT